MSEIDKHVPVGALLLLVIVVTVGRGGAAYGLPTLDALIAAAESEERKLVNLHVKGHMSVELRGVGEKEWESTPEGETVEAWYNGLRNSKARQEVQNRVLRWTAGAAPYAQDCTSIGFDGSQGRIAYHTSGEVGAQHDVHRGDILPERPALLRRGNVTTGLSVSPYGFDRGDGTSHIDYFKQIAAAGVPVDIAEEQFLDSTCIRVSVEGNGLRETWWLDTSKSMAIRGYDLAAIDKLDAPTESIRVTRMKEVGDGLWYPMEGYIEKPYKVMKKESDGKIRINDTGRIKRTAFEIETAVANDPAFSDDIFCVQFPNGYFVQDNSTGVHFEVGQSPEELASAMETIVAKLNEPSAADVTAPSLPRAQSAGDTTGSSTQSKQSEMNTPPFGKKALGWHWKAAIAAGGVLVIAVLAYMRRKKTTVRLPAIIGLLTLAGVAADVRSTPSELYYSNCGVNVTVLSLRLMGLSIPVKQIATELNAGDRFERQCSLADIVRAVEGHGLIAEAYKSDTVAEMLDMLRPGTAMIVRLAVGTPPDERAHFVCMWRTPTGLYFIDPPKAPSLLPSQHPETFDGLEAFSGQCVLIRQSERVAQGAPHAVVDNDVINLGDIPITTQSIGGSFTIRNTGAAPLEIKAIIAGCANCTHLSMSSGVLASGESRDVQVVFDKKLLPPGPAQRNIRILTNDPNVEQLVVSFRFMVQGLPKEEDIQLVPQIVDYGRCFQQKIGASNVRVSVVVPKGKQPTGVVSGQPSCADLVVTPLGQKEENDKVVYEFVLSWRLPPSGPFEESIAFQEIGTAELRMTVRGDAVPSATTRPS